MTYDFDEDSQNEYNGNEAETKIEPETNETEEESFFPSITPPTAEQAGDEKIVESRIEKTEPRKEKNSKIEIDIKSVNDLTSSLEFSAQQFNAAIGRIEKNNDLMHILELLNQIKIDQFENFKNIEKNINLDNAEKIIEDKILSSVSKVDKKINANIRVIESKTKNVTEIYQKYAEAFEDPDVIDQLENIEKIEKSLSGFKFRNIVFSSIITAIITATVTFIAADAGLKSYYETKAENVATKNLNATQKVTYLLAKRDVQIFQDKKTVQLIFPKKEKVEYFKSNDGRKVFQFEK